MKAGGGALHRVFQLGVTQLSRRPAFSLADDGDPIRIRPAVGQHGRLIRIQAATREPPDERHARRGVHDLAVGRRPDDAELLDQCVPEPGRVLRRLLAEIGVGGAAVCLHEPPEPALPRLLLRR